MTTRAKAEEQPPPPVQYNFVCFWSDGFKTVTWEEMLEHYRTAHPDEPLINFVEVVWV